MNYLKFVFLTQVTPVIETTPVTKPYPYPTVRPRRTNCSAPAIEQFPRPLMGPEARKHGGLIIHIVVAIYTFLGLAIVCDDYFVSSLDRICEGESLLERSAFCCKMIISLSSYVILRVVCFT